LDIGKTFLDFYRIGFGLILKSINQLLIQRWGKETAPERAELRFLQVDVITVMPSKKS